MTIQNNVSSSNITRHQANPEIYTIRSSNLKTSLIHINQQIDGIEGRGVVGPERLREFLIKETNQWESIKRECNTVIQLSPRDPQTQELNTLVEKIQSRFSKLQGLLSNMS